MCDCLTQLENQMKEGHPDFTIPKKWVVIKDEKTGKKIPDPRPFFVATYHPKKKDGSVSARAATVSVSPTFCPFCGKEY